jgi:hypothetical protein
MIRVWKCENCKEEFHFDDDKIGGVECCGTWMEELNLGYLSEQRVCDGCGELISLRKGEELIKCLHTTK